MRAWTKGSSIVKIKVEEFHVFDLEIFSPRCDYSVRTSTFKYSVSIWRLSNNQCSVNLSHVISEFGSQGELNTCQKIIGCFEVDETNVSDLFCNCSVSTVFPSSKVIKVGSDGRILPVRISWNVFIIDNWSARILSWHHVVEDSKSISTHGMSRIASELSNLVALMDAILRS